MSHRAVAHKNSTVEIIKKVPHDGGNLPTGEFTEDEFGVKIQGTISLLYDENNLYVFLEVTDDKLYASNDDTLAYWAQGSGVINMYYPGDAGGDNEMYYKMRIAHGAETYNATAHNTEDEFADDCNYVFKETSSGWNLEYQIKLNKAIKQGDPFQFALQVCSVSADKNMGFAHVNDNYNQITFPFVLGDAVVIPEPEPEPVVEATETTEVTVATEAMPQLQESATAPQTGDGVVLMLAVMLIAAVFGIVVFRKKIKN